jgi:aminoglycoside phosphotransferase (APT) family kinase protein
VHVPGYTVEGRAARGESETGAWFATDSRGRRVVLKRTDDHTAIPRFEALTVSLDALRAKGYPAPEYTSIDVIDGDVVVAQSRLDGRTDVTVNERTIEHVLELNELQADVPAPRYSFGWGDFMLHTLTEGEDGWCVHDSMHAWSPRSRRIIERAEELGASMDPSLFPETGIVHLDLHAGNVLFADDGSITGVVDWEGAIAGDHRFDLTSFAFCTEVNSGTSASLQPVWDVLEATVEPDVLRAYAVHQAVRLIDWMIRHHTPPEVEAFVDAGERLLARYDV